LYSLAKKIEVYCRLSCNLRGYNWALCELV